MSRSSRSLPTVVSRSSLRLTPAQRGWNPGRLFSILDEVKGPTGHGPSSSHTIAPQRIAFHEVFEALGGRPDAVRVELYNSFATTGAGQGTRGAIVAGLLGFAANDPGTAGAPGLVKTLRIEWVTQIVPDTETDPIDRHPNRLVIEARRGLAKIRVEALSIGGGNYEVVTRAADRRRAAG